MLGLPTASLARIDVVSRRGSSSSVTWTGMIDDLILLLLPLEARRIDVLGDYFATEQADAALLGF